MGSIFPKLPGCVGTAGQISMSASHLVKEEKRSWVNLWVSMWGAAGQKEIFPDKILILSSQEQTGISPCSGESSSRPPRSRSTCFLKVMRGSDLIGSVSVTPQTHPWLITPDSFQTDHQQDEGAACTMLPPG